MRRLVNHRERSAWSSTLVSSIRTTFGGTTRSGAAARES